MSVLILHRNPLEPFPYDQWLAGYDGDVVVLAARDKIELFGEEVPTGHLGYARLEVLDHFDKRSGAQARDSNWPPSSAPRVSSHTTKLTWTRRRGFASTWA